MRCRHIGWFMHIHKRQDTNGHIHREIKHTRTHAHTFLSSRRYIFLRGEGMFLAAAICRQDQTRAREASTNPPITLLTMIHAIITTNRRAVQLCVRNRVRTNAPASTWKMVLTRCAAASLGGTLPCVWPPRWQVAPTNCELFSLVCGAVILQFRITCSESDSSDVEDCQG